MIPQEHNAPILWKARYIFPFADERPACGSKLFEPLSVLENQQILTQNGLIQDMGKRISAPKNCEVRDLGEKAILPAFYNCHTHLQLSVLHDKTTAYKGFVPWLRSLVPHIITYAQTGIDEAAKAAIHSACLDLENYGTAGIGDVGGSLPGALTLVRSCCEKKHILARYFCEHFGFGKSEDIWPDRCKKEIAEDQAVIDQCAPAGHALYSVSKDTLQKAHAWCQKHKRKFSLHLAESPEESQLLLDGTGDLTEYYRGMVLPEDWRPPALPPLLYALKLGILTKNTLAVHGAQLNRQEIGKFAASGASLCICARSNCQIGVGQPLIKELAQQKARLCLGTDGLTSCPDLDLRNEVLFLQTTHDLPLGALWRMAISNGAAVLDLPAPGIKPGSPAKFSIWSIKKTDV